MGSDSVDFPIIHHNDSIGIFDRIDPLGNDDRCRSGISCFNPARILRSVFVSTALVESSRIRIFGLLTALARSLTAAFVHRRHYFLLERSMCHIYQEILG